MNLDHICLAVRKIDPAREKLCSILGYRPRTEKVKNTRQKVVVQFICKEGSIDIKLIEPLSADSPIVDFLRKGGGIHHVCFRTDDVEAAANCLSDKGARLVTPPQPGEAFDEHLIAFLYLGFGLNVEVIDTDDRRAMID